MSLRIVAAGCRSWDTEITPICHWNAGKWRDSFCHAHRTIFREIYCSVAVIPMQKKRKRQSTCRVNYVRMLHFCRGELQAVKMHPICIYGGADFFFCCFADRKSSLYRNWNMKGTKLCSLCVCYCNVLMDSQPTIGRHCHPHTNVCIKVNINQLWSEQRGNAEWHKAAIHFTAGSIAIMMNR